VFQDLSNAVFTLPSPQQAKRSVLQYDTLRCRACVHSLSSQSVCSGHVPECHLLIPHVTYVHAAVQVGDFCNKSSSAVASIHTQNVVMKVLCVQQPATISSLVPPEEVCGFPLRYHWQGLTENLVMHVFGLQHRLPPRLMEGLIYHSAVAAVAPQSSIVLCKCMRNVAASCLHASLVVSSLCACTHMHSCCCTSTWPWYSSHSRCAPGLALQ
jgi:hypothetical protein